MRGFWTCQRRKGGERCGTRNENRYRNCRACGKPRPSPPPSQVKRRKPCRGCGGEKDVFRAGAHFCSVCEADPLARPNLINGQCSNGHELREVGVYLDARGYDGHRPRWNCKACAAVEAKAAWADPSTRERNRLANRRATLKRVYGITLEQWDALYVAQDGRCAICLRPLAADKGQPGQQAAVDHDHETGEIRGLLCRMPCNYGIGVLREEPERLRRAAEYLEDPPARHVLKGLS
jgi:hypothetical protein